MTKSCHITINPAMVQSYVSQMKKTVAEQKTLLTNIERHIAQAQTHMDTNASSELASRVSALKKSTAHQRKHVEQYAKFLEKVAEQYGEVDMKVQQSAKRALA